MEDDWTETEEEAEVQVLVLSPRCWAVSAVCFLDEPAEQFPSELCSYLNQFTQFYTHSECHLLPSSVKPGSTLSLKHTRFSHITELFIALNQSAELQTQWNVPQSRAFLSLSWENLKLCCEIIWQRTEIWDSNNKVAWWNDQRSTQPPGCLPPVWGSPIYTV